MEIEDLETRLEQVAKRARKLENFSHRSGVTVEGEPDAAVALIGFGSTWGVLQEAREVLAREGIAVKHIHFSRLSPFPVHDFHLAMDGVQQALVVELNSSGQLSMLIQQQAGYHNRLENCLKYDGDPISLKEILARARAVFPRVGVLN